MKGSGVTLGWRVGGVEGWRGRGGGGRAGGACSMSLYKTSSILPRIHGFLWPKPHACPLQPGGRRKRNIVRNRARQSRTDNLGDRLPSVQWCSSAKWKECACDDEPVSLSRTRQVKRTSDGGAEVGLNK